MAIEFDFIDRHGRGWRHSNALSAVAIWPAPDNIVSIENERDRRTFVTGFMDSQADTSKLHLNTNTGLHIAGHGRRSTFDVALYNDNDGTVRAHGFIGSTHPLADRGRLGFEYHIDLASLLWRRAPVISPGRVECEAADYIDIQPLDKPPPGLERSDIEIEDTGGASPPPLRLSLDRSGPMREPIQILEKEVVPRSGLKKRVAIPVAERRVIAYGAAPGVEFLPGTIHGLLRLDRYVAPFDEEPDHRFTVGLDFLDEAGKAWRYVGLCWAALLWPPDDARARIAARPGPGDMEIAVSIDGRDDAAFRLDTGETIVARMKYFSFGLAATPGDDPAAIRVHAAMCPIEHPRSVDSTLSIEYDVPVFDLLWRKASLILDDDLDPEGGRAIDLRQIDSVDPSLPRSPIRVLRTGAPSAENPGDRHAPGRRYVPGAPRAER